MKLLKLHGVSRFNLWHYFLKRKRKAAFFVYQTVLILSWCDFVFLILSRCWMKLIVIRMSSAQKVNVFCMFKWNQPRKSRHTYLDLSLSLAMLVSQFTRLAVPGIATGWHGWTMETLRFLCLNERKVQRKRGAMDRASDSEYINDSRLDAWVWVQLVPK